MDGEELDLGIVVFAAIICRPEAISVWQPETASDDIQDRYRTGEAHAAVQILDAGVCLLNAPDVSLIHAAISS